ncbi:MULTISPECIES: helix-turn-helix domain-containing protein [Acidianus]|uniref:XRE family transcriptional regulator n=1 Tax=Candidatus Acidianus copahuensis TaxID=1160895 RepID=A0A031LM83_9CREN|nr:MULTISPECIES: helix-turn-helix domain-containing protein [Acidianus]EZQ06758.1 XRE family transcriptional regulator [Candidatus Acidianus copahuensis]NON61260.1 helix-turn-helix domain-containing protein [Acidianus sp. RZ1]
MESDYVIEAIGKRISGDIVWSSNSGVAMRKWREMFNVSQSELAKTLGIKQTVIADYERNRRQPGSAFVKKFVEGLMEIDRKRGLKVISELGKAFTLNFSFIQDLRDFETPVRLDDLIIAIDGIPIGTMINAEKIYGYVVTDSINAIATLNGMEFYQFLSLVFNRTIIFTKVSSGRSPMIALKISPVKPKVVVFHRPLKMDPLAMDLAEKEGISVVISTKASEEKLLKSLKDLAVHSE